MKRYDSSPYVRTLHSAFDRHRQAATRLSEALSERPPTAEFPAVDVDEEEEEEESCSSLSERRPRY